MARLATALSSRARLSDVVEQAQLVESLGYDRVWIPEISGRDAFVTAAIVADRTESIGLGLGVVPVPSRPLPALEMAVAAVSEVASARLAVGFGAGHSETAASQFGWVGTFDSDRIETTIVRLRDALATGILTHTTPSGEPLELRLSGQHVDHQPEFFVGALTPPSLRMAIRCADGILLNWVTFRRAERIADEIAAMPARGSFTIAMYVPVCVVADAREREDARRVVARQLASYSRLRAYGRGLSGDGFARELALLRDVHARGGDPASVVSDALIDAVALIGDEDDVQRGLERLRRSGIDEPVLAPVVVGADPLSSLMITWTALASDD